MRRRAAHHLPPAAETELALGGSLCPPATHSRTVAPKPLEHKMTSLVAGAYPAASTHDAWGPHVTLPGGMLGVGAAATGDAGAAGYPLPAPAATDDVAVVARAKLPSAICRLLAHLPTLGYNDTHRDFPCCQYLFIWGMCLRRPPSATPGSYSAMRPSRDCAVPKCFAQGVAGERRRCKWERHVKTTHTSGGLNSRCVCALAAASVPTLCTSRT